MRTSMARRFGVLLVVAALFGAYTCGRVWAQDKPAAPAGDAPAVAPAVAPAAAPAGMKVTEDASQKAKPVESMNFLNVVTRAGWFGVLIWVGLIGASIISVALIVDSYLTIREAKIAPPTLVESVRSALQEGDLFKAMQHCDNTPVPLARI